jgi:hypothetical protein
MPEPPNAAEVAARAAREVLDAGEVRASAELPHGLRFLHEKELEQDRQLKLSYATWLRRLLAGQLAVADIVFVVYAWVGRRWKLEPIVIDIWLGATVVQVVGIVLVVTRHLFPQRDSVQQGNPTG